MMYKVSNASNALSGVRGSRNIARIQIRVICSGCFCLGEDGKEQLKSFFLDGICSSPVKWRGAHSQSGCHWLSVVVALVHPAGLEAVEVLLLVWDEVYSIGSLCRGFPCQFICSFISRYPCVPRNLDKPCEASCALQILRQIPDFFLQ